MTTPAITVGCHACAGRFGFTVEGELPTVYHSLPYCPAFVAIETTVDAIQYAERCNLAVTGGHLKERPSKNP
jgi:hypothetical protein